MSQQIYIERDSLCLTHFPKWDIDPSDPKIWLPKAKFAVLDENFVAGEFSRDLRPFLMEHVGQYQLEDGDADPGPSVCEDFAQACAFFMATSFRKTQKREPGGGPGWGPFSYTCLDGRHHTLNCWLGLVRGELALLHYEPQLQAIATLDPAEIRAFNHFRLGS